MKNKGLIIVLLILAFSIGGLTYLLYEKVYKNEYRYYKGEIRKTPKYYKAKPENAPNYYKGSLNKVPNYYKKNVEDMPNYYKPKGSVKEKNRANLIRSIQENW
ncbi:hypothetical protein [Persephonella sp.]